MSTIRNLTIICATLALGGCGQSNLSRLGRAMQIQENEERCRQRAVEFVSFASNGKLEQMMRYTSPLTLRNSGEDHARKMYSEQLIPAFQGSQVVWNKGSTLVTEGNNSGFQFSGSLKKEKSTPFYIVVFDENGELLIANIRSTKKL